VKSKAAASEDPINRSLERTCGWQVYNKTSHSQRKRSITYFIGQMIVDSMVAVDSQLDSDHSSRQTAWSTTE
jgi:hypothetical protein